MTNTNRTTLKGYAQKGFTIIELTVVIVVIAVLAAISIVSYTGITDRAQETTLQSDLKNAQSELELNRTWAGKYPADAASINDGKGLSKSKDTTFTYKYTASADTYCLSAKSSKQGVSPYYITSDLNAMEKGECPTQAASAPGAPLAHSESWLNGDGAGVDPFVGLYVGWREPADNGSPITQYRVRAKFGASCATKPDYTFTVNALTVGATDDKTSRDANGYLFMSGNMIDGCRIDCNGTVSTVAVSARNAIGWGPERTGGVQCLM